MILDKIVASTKKRISGQQERQPLAQLREKVQNMGTDGNFPFEQALKRDQLSFICEVKKASPSKGLISADFPYVQIAEEYEQAGADVISVLTEPEYFLGSSQYLQEIRRAVKVPLLRKDFIIDPYQIYEAKVLGASAVLLICAILSREQLSSYLKLADSLGLSSLVEAHTEEEVQMALSAGARVIGVNNRNLTTFQVDFTTCLKLRSLVPPEVAYVAESGIRDGDQLAQLKSCGVQGVLIGETLMRSLDKQALLSEWRNL
ncbi:indole-3-glycerol phosphate synthase TrpC [Aminipila butyrica]|uniref:Indole-3-glycerol phosphate synthase n=1 Tax=Aminipila butyrica TaxID=433296 RepID=A0A858BWP4_9FIRM|nr:indole-3-glycerol phosphate synthase TrpC [Aminipila butyrica]QIB69144.1 indole-3-glycerol phosphate synthase TrpC [Aminipila butyrica]